jgi:hypothetical protein
VPVGFKLEIEAKQKKKVYGKKVIYFKNLEYDWSGSKQAWLGNSSLTFEGEFSH